MIQRLGFVILLCAAWSLNAQLLLEHDYDPVSDAVVSWRLEPGQSASQSFELPTDGRVATIRIKLTRWGEPLPLEYRLGRSPGGSKLGSGTIDSERVGRWFEHWTELRLPRPVAGKAHERLYLEVRLAKSSTGAYDLYGTASEAVPRPEFRQRFRYTPSWFSRSGQHAAFESTANVDYGTSTPHYEGGAALDSGHHEIAALDFAFQLIGERPPANRAEERFAFIEKLTGSLFPHSLRSRTSRAATNEVTIDSRWRVATSVQSPVVETAVSEFQDFLARGMQVRPEGVVKNRIVVETGCESAPRKPEGFAVRVTRNSIQVCGYDDRGAMQGLHFLEARMRLRRGPFLARGEESHAPRYSPRITTAPFYSRAELDVPAGPYTDGLLGRISRAGFNAIWVWCDLDSIARSDVFAELDRSVPAHQAKLNALVERASRYGVDVYVYLANRALPEEFFRDHPGVRGSAIAAYGGVNVLCSSHPRVLDYFRSAAHNLSTSVPGIKGVVLLVGGEGFLHCYSRRLSCSRCARRRPEDVVAGLSTAVMDGLRPGNPGAAIAIWPYNADWSKEDTAQSRMIEAMPQGMTLLTEFAKGSPVTFGGISIPAYDYPISIVGPSGRFAAQSESARKTGHTLWVKTEHAIAVEFIATPYIPVFFQWAERFRRIRDAGEVSGIFANWMHYGFTDSRASDLFYWNIWEQAQNPDRLLTAIAARDFGDEAAEPAVRAWRLFSQAIQQYPFCWGVGMGPIQSGPAHPLFFDAGYAPVHNAGRQFRNTLEWTEAWGPELTIEQLRKMEKLWAAGVAEMERAVSLSDAGLRPETRRELGVSRALLASVRSAIHVARFYVLREELRHAPGKARARALLSSMADVAVEELRNAREVLPFVREDSRLGYANSAGSEQIGVVRGGIYSPRAIEKKIAQVERMLREEIPAYRRAHGLE